MVLKTLLSVLYGIIFGVSNVIPGVSGGTMMVVFGCYDIVCDALALDIKSIKKNLGFLIPFGIGAAVGIVGFSFLVTYMFDEYPIPTYMFFIGLILGSIPFILRTGFSGKLKNLKSSYLFPCLLALTAVVVMGISQNDDSTDAITLRQTVSPDNPEITVVRLTNNTSQTIKNWILEFPEGSVDRAGGAKLFYNAGTFEKISSLFKGTDTEKEPNAFSGEDGSEEIAPKKSITFTYVSKAGANLKFDEQISYKVDYIVFIKILFGAFIAAIAMIVPGLSGSFVMVLLGIYSTVIGAIKDLNILILFPTAVGVLGGMIMGAKLIKWLLERYHALVYSAILGLIIGSVFVIFPEGVSFETQTFIGIGSMILGGAISLTVGMEKRSNEDLKKTSSNLR